MADDADAGPVDVHREAGRLEDEARRLARRAGRARPGAPCSARRSRSCRHSARRSAGDSGRVTIRSISGWSGDQRRKAGEVRHIIGSMPATPVANGGWCMNTRSGVPPPSASARASHASRAAQIVAAVLARHHRVERDQPNREIVDDVVQERRHAGEIRMALARATAAVTRAGRDCRGSTNTGIGSAASAVARSRDIRRRARNR